MEKHFFEHIIAYITARISIEVPNGRPWTTGFFLRSSLNDGTNRSIILMISNKHMFPDSEGKLTISLNRKKGDGTPEFGNIRTYNLNLPSSDLFFTHPDSDVDLACVNVTSIAETDAFFLCLIDKFFINYAEVFQGVTLYLWDIPTVSATL